MKVKSDYFVARNKIHFYIYTLSHHFRSLFLVQLYLRIKREWREERGEERQGESKRQNRLLAKNLSFVRILIVIFVRFGGLIRESHQLRCNYADLEKLVNLEDNQPAEMQARTRRAGSTEPIKFPYVRGKLAR